MNLNALMKKSFLSMGIMLVAACSLAPVDTAIQTSQKTENSEQEQFVAPQERKIRDTEEVVLAYRYYANVLQAAKLGRDDEVQSFLSRNADSAMGESVLNEYLKTLGNQGKKAEFQAALARLPEQGRHQEVRCYAVLFGLDTNDRQLDNLVRETGKLPAGCNALLQEQASRGMLPVDDVWRRIRALISDNYLTDARNLAGALGSPLNGTEGQGSKENLLRQIIAPDAVKTGVAVTRLNQLAEQLTPQQQGFAWGVLALAQAKQHNFNTALNYYRRADLKQLTQEQAEWYVRSALRVQNWNEVANVIESMPEQWQNDSAWLYWLGRSYAAKGQKNKAHALYQKAASSGRNFYAVMALEELSQRVSTKNNVAQTREHDVATLAKDGVLQQALSLFQKSLENGDWAMRRQAQAEWRYAIRDMNETTMLAAAQLAYQHQFYEMAITSAEKTDRLLNYNLRYITPYRNLVERYAQAAGIDGAWVYGLIRQESRFITGAKSSVGATGLMQVMPATAQEIARKIGISPAQLHTLEGNIQMGTWYLSDAKRRLQNNEVMATAGYNAGPGRARNWQANTPLEGAIYAETIPFNETRDYVKKVMTNAVYYADLLGLPQTSLKQRMGTVPAR